MAPGGYKYVNVRSKIQADDSDFFKRTLARLDKIRNHLQTAPRSGRLRDKVCIITGVGSLKGMGCVDHLFWQWAEAHWGWQTGGGNVIRA